MPDRPMIRLPNGDILYWVTNAGPEHPVGDGRMAGEPWLPPETTGWFTGSYGPRPTIDQLKGCGLAGIYAEMLP